LFAAVEFFVGELGIMKMVWPFILTIQ